MARLRQQTPRRFHAQPFHGACGRKPGGIPIVPAETALAHARLISKDREREIVGEMLVDPAVAFHTGLALKEGIAPADVQAIREGRLPKDSKLAALSGLRRP